MIKGNRISMALVVAASLVLANGATAQDRRADGKKDEAPRPTPIGNPGSWIPADGYPAAAAASAEEGRVGFMLDVDETGRVSDCKVTTSSESPLLDETTCYYMSANARFKPARDAKGKAVAGKWGSSMLWKLKAVAPAPAAAPEAAPPVPPPAARKN